LLCLLHLTTAQPYMWISGYKNANCTGTLNFLGVFSAGCNRQFWNTTGFPVSYLNVDCSTYNGAFVSTCTDNACENCSIAVLHTSSECNLASANNNYAGFQYSCENGTNLTQTTEYYTVTSYYNNFFSDNCDIPPYYTQYNILPQGKDSCR